MKKSIIYFMALGIIIELGWTGLCEGLMGYGGEELKETFPITSEGLKGDCKELTDLGNCVSVKENDETIIVKLLKVFGLDSDMGRDLKFIDYAKAIINMALGLIAFIALIMAIYTFYMMFFSENEAGIKKAKGNLTGIIIALGVVGLAWIIVSFIFRLYKSNWQEREGDIEARNIQEDIKLQHD